MCFIYVAFFEVGSTFSQVLPLIGLSAGSGVTPVYVASCMENGRSRLSLVVDHRVDPQWEINLI